MYFDQRPRRKSSEDGLNFNAKEKDINRARRPLCFNFLPFALYQIERVLKPILLQQDRCLELQIEAHISRRAVKQHCYENCIVPNLDAA